LPGPPPSAPLGRRPKANPEIYRAPGPATGAAPTDDKNVVDDFYWAAAELYITTKTPEYKDFINQVGALQEGGTPTGNGKPPACTRP